MALSREVKGVAYVVAKRLTEVEFERIRNELLADAAKAQAAGADDKALFALLKSRLEHR